MLDLITVMPEKKKKLFHAIRTYQNYVREDRKLVILNSHVMLSKRK